MSKDRQRVLVFGATGEIGGRIARGCADAGHVVTGVSRGTNTRHHPSLNGVEMVTGDKTDPEFVAQLARDREYDVVIDSVPSTDDVALACEHFNGRIGHYLMCSSTGTYVPLLYMPADEDHPWREETYCNFYAASQRDAFALDLWEQHGFPVTILRPTNIIGYGRAPLELWGGRSIRYWQMVKAGEPADMPGDGKVLLQSGCNDDLATAFALAVPKGDEIAGEVFIISSRKAITLDRFLAVGREILGSDSPVQYLSPEEILRRRPGDATEGGLQFLVEHMCFDIDKAESVLGYSPRHSPEEGLEKALRWCLDEGLL